MKFLIVWCSCIVVLGLQSVSAAPKAKGLPGGHMQITEVFFLEGEPDKLFINGKDFDFGDGELVVTLGEEGQLTIISESATDIEVELPNLTPGDYLVSAFRQGGQSQGDEYDLTIGAVGLQGPPGPRGAKGDSGASNRQRLLGDLVSVSGALANSQVSCPVGQLLTGCSSECKISTTDCHLRRCAGVPTNDLQTCIGQAEASNTGGGACLVNVRAIAICADP